MRTAQGSFRFTPAELPLFRTAVLLDGRVRVERVPPVAPAAREQLGQQDLPALWAARSGQLWVAWQEYDDTAEAVYARRRRTDGWEPAWRLESSRDVFGVAAAEDERGRVWVMWSMQVNGNWDLYARSYKDGKLGETLRLTDDPGPDIWHRMTTDNRGRAWLVWQGFRNGTSAIFARCADGGNSDCSGDCAASPRASW